MCLASFKLEFEFTLQVVSSEKTSFIGCLLSVEKMLGIFTAFTIPVMRALRRNSNILQYSWTAPRVPVFYSSGFCTQQSEPTAIISTEQSPQAIPTCIRFSSLSSGTINYNFELIRCQLSLSTGSLVRLVTVVCSHRQFVSWRSLNLSRLVACVCFTDTVHRLLLKKEAIEFKPRRPYLAYTRPTLSHRTHGATLALSQITKLAGSPRTCQGPLDGRM